MSPIITITFNPALDKSTSVPALVAEKKLKCSIPKSEAGGGGINVARAIKSLGGDVKAIYLAGGPTGELLARLVDEENVGQQIIHTRNDTRENIMVTDSSTGLQYRFCMPGLAIYEEEWQKLLKVVAMQEGVKYIVASGSLPPGVPLNVFGKIAAIANEKGARFMLDTSGLPLKLALEHEIFLIKPSLAELSSIAGVDELKGDAIAEAARNIIYDGNCKAVVVSLGAAGALLVTKDITKQFTAPPVKIKGTVGAGDCMVAGITYSLFKGSSVVQAVQYGIACGTAATLNEGTALCKLTDVERLYSEIKEKDHRDNKAMAVLR